VRDEVDVLIAAERRRLTSRAYYDNAVGALANMPFNERIEGSEVYAAISLHRADQGHEATLWSLVL
jgi:hypothetical protein